MNINKINTARIPTVDGLFRKPKVIVSLENKSRGFVAEEIIEILLNSQIRRGESSNVDYETQRAYVTKIKKFIDNRLPIDLVFQGLPFKCHNPFETIRKTPDLGEIASLQRMADINETIKQIYPLGVRFTALAEGKTYKDLFGASDKEVQLFQNRMNELICKMALEDVVRIVDFVDVLDDPNDFFTECANEIKNIKVNSVKHLSEVMMRSLPIMETMKISDLLAIFGNAPIKNLTQDQLETLQKLHEESTEVTLRYQAIENIKKKRNIINNLFPDYLYVTILPKPGRYAFHPVHKNTRLFPHHGVPVLESDKVDIIFLGEVLANPNIYTAVYSDDDIEDAPIYFLKGRQHIRK